MMRRFLTTVAWVLMATASYGQSNSQKIEDFARNLEQAAEAFKKDRDTGSSLFGVDSQWTQSRTGTIAGTLAGKNPRDYKVGDQGCTTASFQVINIISAKECLVQSRSNVSLPHKEPAILLIRGFNMAKVTDDARFVLQHRLTISGTYTYTTVTGAKKTVLVLERKAQEATSSTVALDKNPLVGRWKLMNDKGVVSSYLTISKSLEAKRDHVPDSVCKLEIVGKDARMAWSDGFKDVLRMENGKAVFLILGNDKGTDWSAPPKFRLQAVRIPVARKK